MAHTVPSSGSSGYSGSVIHENSSDPSGQSSFPSQIKVSEIQDFEVKH